MIKLSIIVPCFNEEESLPLFYDATKKVLKQLPDAEPEFIFIDDGSRDHTLHVMRTLSAKDSTCHYITFSRNFGKEAAMYAGLQAATGDYCVIMDADLQHPPALLPQMFHTLQTENYDCCAGLRTTRDGEGAVRNFLSGAFYKLLKKLSKMDVSDGAGDFRMMKRKVVDSILACKEYNRYMKGIFSFVGFDTKWIAFENTERAAGNTKWNFRSLFRYAIDGIFSFSTAPVTMAGLFSVILFLISLCMGGGILIHVVIFGNPLKIWLAIACLILFLSALQMLFITVLGQYICKNYMESKARPLYLIKEQV